LNSEAVDEAPAGVWEGHDHARRPAQHRPAESSNVQTGVVAKTHDRDAILANIAVLADKARRAGVSVIWVRHENEELVPGQDAWQIAPELVPPRRAESSEKRYGDAFEDTKLEALLADLRRRQAAGRGAMTDQCIRSSLHGALARGYDTVLVKDAHTTEDLSQWGARRHPR